MLFVDARWVVKQMKVVNDEWRCRVGCCSHPGVQSSPYKKRKSETISSPTGAESCMVEVSKAA